MPAAAVIPAPIAYIKVVAVKKLVVGISGRSRRSVVRLALTGLPSSRSPCLLFTAVEWGICDVYCEKIRVFKAGSHLNTLAWNNGIGLGSYFVGFWD